MSRPPAVAVGLTSPLSSPSGFGFTQGVDKPVDNFVFRFRQDCVQVLSKATSCMPLIITVAERVDRKSRI